MEPGNDASNARQPETASFEGLLAAWAESDDFEGELAHLERIRARGAIFGEPTPPLDPVILDRLAARGIDRLYRHQARAVDAIREGRHTVVVSGTASGKSLCYQIPLAEAIVHQPKTSALLLFPTKALAQDQVRSIGTLGMPGLVAATYDGDTPGEDRSWIRRHANVILTNPDMLHFGILPNHARWADFFHRLEYVVVDEAHMFRGIFGTHVSMVLRRLRRLADHYGASPTFVFTSATIGNPGDLATRLSGLEVMVAEGDDSPSGEKLVALWNPPIEDPELGTRRSAMAEATDLFVNLVRHDRHTIVFSRSRKATELIYRWAKDRVGPDRRDRVAPYRSGYLPAERREIEQALFSGKLLGVTATNALELGIDVGSLDAAIINTFPGTIASFRQQAGRAGRAQRTSLAVLVGGEDSLDQYFMHHPTELFTRPPEAAVINPDNPLVLEAHTACAAYELPLRVEDREVLGEGMEEAATRLTAEGHLMVRDGRLAWARRQAPAPRVGIRTSGGSPFTIVDEGTGEALGTLEESRTFRDAHPGAIYLHRGDTFVVRGLDLSKHEILVRTSLADYYTQPQQDTWLEILGVDRRGRLGKLDHFVGTVQVENHVVAYKKRKLGSGEVLGLEPLDLPSTVFETKGIWLTVPDSLFDEAGVEPRDLLGTLHAAEHAGIGMLPLFAICDRWDIGGLSTNHHPGTGLATIFIYEAYPGGAGISEVAYDVGSAHLTATLEALRACPCDHGCPSCVQSPKCGNFNEPLSKHGAIRFLDAALR